MSSSFSEPSLGDLAKESLDLILRLAGSGKISEKLKALNMLLFVFVVAIAATFYFASSQLGATAITYGVDFVVFFILALVLGLGYAFVLEICSKISSESISGLRLSVLILFISLSSVLAGLLLGIPVLVKLAILLLLVQLGAIFIGSAVLGSDTKDTEVDKNDLWILLGRISTIITILTFVFDIALIAIKFLF